MGDSHQAGQYSPGMMWGLERVLREMPMAATSVATAIGMAVPMAVKVR